MKMAFQGPKQRSAFRDKNLAAAISVAAFLLTNSVFSQTVPTRVGLNTVNTIGNNNRSGAYRIVLYIPQDTAQTADSGAVAFLNSTLYQKNTNFWVPVSKARKLTDSSFIVGNDTISMNGTERNLATTQLRANADYLHNWANHNLVIDSIKTLSFVTKSQPLGGNHRITGLAFNPTSLAFGIHLGMSMRNAANSTDSIAGAIDYRYPSDVFINTTNLSLGKTGSVTVGPGVVDLYGTDSVRIRALGASGVGMDSVFVPGRYNGAANALNSIYKVPVSAISRNLANTQLIANGNYTHDWNHNIFYLDNIKTWFLHNVEDDGFFSTRKMNNWFLTSNSFFGTPIALYSTLRNIANTSDSMQLGFRNSSGGAKIFAADLGKNIQSVITTNLGSSWFASMLTSNARSLTSGVTADTTSLWIIGADSILIKGLPVISSADTLVALLTQNNLGFNKIAKVPVSALGGNTNQYFAQTATVSISGTTTETSLIGSGSGTLSVNHVKWVSGKTYRVTIMGAVSTDGSNPSTPNFRLKLGGSTIATTGGLFIGTGITDRAFEITVTITARSISSSGTLFARGFWRDENDGINKCDNGTNSSTVNFTTDMNWDATAQWGNNASGNSVNIYILTIEEVN